MNPVTRYETYLAKLGGQDVEIPAPVTREETLLAKACGEETAEIVPVTRREMLLDNLSGGDHDITPVTRIEVLIAKAAGAEVTEFDPVTREEVFWSQVEGGSGDSCITLEGDIVRFSASRSAPFRRLQAAIEPVQSGSGDPSPSNIRPISGWTGANIHVSPTTDAQDGTTYSITFPSAAGTAYGGTLDVINGKLTVDMAMADMGTLTWSGWEQGGSFIFYSHISDKMPVRDIPCISSQYAYNSAITGSWSDLHNGELTGQYGGDNVYVRDARYSSIADFKTAMSGVQLVYPLATPIEYTLTPTEVTTLIGENNVWADTGDVTVEVKGEVIT